MTSHSLDPKKDPKNEKPFVAALFATVCRASSVFLLRARCPLKLTTRLEIFYSHIKKKERKNRSRKLSAHGRPIAITDHCPHMGKISSSTFVSPISRPRPRNSKNREQSQKRVTIDDHSSQFYSRYFKLYFLKQIVTRKRAYPTRDCDNLPGPTYL